MAGQSSNLGASSSSTRKLEGKRKQSATRADKAKKPNVTARPSGSSVPVVPTNCPTSHAMAVAFPMAGVNGAAPLWSTTAALGAATEAARRCWHCQLRPAPMGSPRRRQQVS